MVIQALHRAEEAKDPFAAALQVVRTAVRVDSAEGLRLARDLSERAQNAQRSLSKGTVLDLRGSYELHASLADLVAPHDEGFRDRELRKAVEAGKLLLRDEASWNVEEELEGFVGWLRRRGTSEWDIRMYVEEKKWQRDLSRRCLPLEIELQECVLQDGVSPDAAEERLAGVLERSSDKQFYGRGHGLTFPSALLRELVELDPDLLIRTRSATVSPKALSRFCFQEARSRAGDGKWDDFTRTLITCAVQNGETRPVALTIYARFDLEAAWRLAQQLPPRESKWAQDDPRGSAMVGVMRLLAEKDLDRALTLAESESDLDLRQALIRQVARVWARKRPESIEEALAQLQPPGSDHAFKAEAAEEFVRRGEVEKAISTGWLSGPQIAMVSDRVPKQLRLSLLYRGLQEATEPLAKIKLAVKMYEVDPQAGLDALEESIPDPRRYVLRGASPEVAKMGPQGILRLYRADRRVSVSESLEHLTLLAQADADAAEAAARTLSGKERDEALGHVAVGIARSDFARARALLSEISDEAREKFEMPARVAYVVTHPAEACSIADSRREEILEEAAVKVAGNGDIAALDRILAVMADRDEMDQRLRKLVECTPMKPDLAVKLLPRIQNPNLYVVAACTLAKEMVTRVQR